MQSFFTTLFLMVIIGIFITISSARFTTAFDAFLGIDANFFVDPHLLGTTKVPEFRDSRKRITQHFSDVLRLLMASKTRGDRPWLLARRMLTFRELRGVAIGYSSKADGSGIGPELAARLVNTASEIVDLGVKDPELFEILGVFEEGFGADRLSDMTLRIIQQDVYAYSERVAVKLGLPQTYSLRTRQRTYQLVRHPQKNKPLLFLPKSILRDLPVA